MQHKSRPLRVWCAASSTGEEPYSIAISLAEAYGTYEPPVEIIASDIDSNVLREASSDIYALQRLESLSLARKKQFFQRGKSANAGKARVVQELRNLIDFRQCSCSLQYRHCDDAAHACGFYAKLCGAAK